MSESITEHKELKSGWKDEVTVKTFKAVDVAKHDSKKDLWMTIHGKVYDLTSYARDHPGGLDALVEVAGTDATSAFEDVGHSDDAREILHGYLVGVLENAQQSQESVDAPAQSTPTAQVVRRQPANEPQTSTAKERALHPAGLAAMAVGAVGLTWAANRLHLIPSTANDISALTPHSNYGRYLVGFLVTTVSAGAVAIAGFKFVDQIMNFNAGFSQYPAHVRSVVTSRTPYHPAGVLIPSQYQKLKLRLKQELSDGIYRFVFDLPTSYSMLGLPIGQHVAVQANINGHVVVRSYTPVSNNRDLGRLELLIRVYPDGQLGNYLKSLSIGDAADFRGPKGAMRYRKGMCKSIGMVAGGTGITPMYQLIRAICEDPTDDTQVTLIYSNRSETDIMLRERLDYFATNASQKFKLLYVVENAPPGWTGAVGRADKEMLAEKMPKASPDTKMMLCGPPGMVNAMKKNLVELGFESPGAVSKITDQIFCF